MRFLLFLLLAFLFLGGCAPKAKKTDALHGRYILALSHLANNDPTAALNELIGVVNKNPRKTEYQEALAYAYFLKKAYPEAERHYLQALTYAKDGSQQAQIENNLGSLYLEMRRWDDALIYFRRAASSLVFQDPEVALTGAGVVLSHQGKPQEAIDSFNEALEREPAYLPAYYRKAQVYRSLGEPELALENYRKILQLNPGNTRARYQLGLTYLELGRTSEAVEAFEETLRRAPDEALGQQVRESLKVLK